MSTAFRKNFLMSGTLKRTLKSDFQQRSPDYCFQIPAISPSKTIKLRLIKSNLLLQDFFTFFDYYIFSSLFCLAKNDE